MMNINRILKNERLMLALTGLNSKEFKELLPTFATVWNKRRREYYNLNAAGNRAMGGGRKGFLKTVEDKLFYILFYYKCYPTFDLAGFIFGCDRSKACLRQQELSKILESSLGKKLVMPKRQMRTIEEFIEAFPEVKEVFIDGTERPIQRPKNKVKQKNNYSGKKKRHTVKNIVIADKDKRIGFLGKTVCGKEHDFTILKEQASPDHMPPEIKKHIDLGFKGIDKQFPGHKISMPKRKPRTKDLSEFAVKQNKKKSSVRVLIENALAGVKRLKIVADVFRNRKEEFNDQVMLVSCGLWNYHLSMK
jgi:hypothetical protein